MQWLERARGALRREVGDIQQQHVALAAGLTSAVAAAAAAPQSPQKAVAAQVGGHFSLRVSVSFTVCSNVMGQQVWRGLWQPCAHSQTAFPARCA